MTNYDDDLAETECAPPASEGSYDEPFRFAEGMIFGALISSAAWAALVIWAIL